MIRTTTSSSMRVKPASSRRVRGIGGRPCVRRGRSPGSSARAPRSWGSGGTRRPARAGAV